MCRLWSTLKKLTVCVEVVLSPEKSLFVEVVVSHEKGSCVQVVVSPEKVCVEVVVSPEKAYVWRLWSALKKLKCDDFGQS